MESRTDTEGREMLTVYETVSARTWISVGSRSVRVEAPALGSAEPWLIRLRDAEGEAMGGVWVSEDEILLLAAAITTLRKTTNAKGRAS